MHYTNVWSSLIATIIQLRARYVSEVYSSGNTSLINDTDEYLLR